MLVQQDITDLKPKWEDVQLGDIITMDYKNAGLCYVYLGDNGKSLVSLSNPSLNWSNIDDWASGTPNKLLRICQPGDTFEIA